MNAAGGGPQGARCDVCGGLDLVALVHDVELCWDCFDALGTSPKCPPSGGTESALEDLLEMYPGLRARRVVPKPPAVAVAPPSLAPCL